jgi:hypothetical protein
MKHEHERTKCLHAKAHEKQKKRLMRRFLERLRRRQKEG